MKIFFLLCSHRLLVFTMLIILFLLVDRSVAQDFESEGLLKTFENIESQTNDDENADSNQDGVTDMEFSDEDIFLSDEDKKPATEFEKSSTQYWQIFKNYCNARLTLDYEFAYQLGDPERIVMNRSSSRLELGHLFANRYYARIDGKLNVFGNNDHFARAEDKSILFDSSLREAYLEASFKNTTIRAGKQILIWGESDTAIITDVVSPRDFSEINFKKLEDARIGQTMLTFSLYSKLGTWDSFINFDPGVDDLPDHGTEYYVPTSMPGVVEIEEDKPGTGNTEYGLRWKKTFGQSDIAIMGADLFENQPVLNFLGFTDIGETRLVRNYNRFKMLGFAGNLSIGNFIFKAETAYNWGRSYQSTDQSTDWETFRKDRFDAAFGLEYSSTNKLWSITLEAANKHIMGWDDTLLNTRRNESAITVIIGRNFLNETLDLEYTLFTQLQSGDTFHKLRMEYEFIDNVTGIVEFGGFTSNDKDGPFWGYRNKQRILMAIQLHI